MWLDAAALVLLGAFAGLGMQRGALCAALALVGLLAAYAGAALAAGPLGAVLAAELGLSALVATALGGTLAFVAVCAVFGLLSALARASDRRRREGASRGALDRLGGAVFGAARGALVVVLLGWLALWLDAARQAGAADWAPEAGSSLTARISQGVVESGTRAALAGRGAAGRAAARAAARPGEVLERGRALLEDPRVRALRDDRLFWTYVEHGKVDAAQNRLAFAKIAYDAEMRRSFADLGLVDARAAADPRAFRRATGAALRQVGPRLRRLRRDPELQRLLEDPEIGRLLAEGDTFALLRHGGFRRLLHRVLRAEPEGDPSSGEGDPGAAKAESRASSVRVGRAGG